jgi:hypothetical protein
MREAIYRAEEYKSLLKGFIRDRFVPVPEVDFSLKSAQVFASICFYLNFLCSATFFLTVSNGCEGGAFYD